MSKKRVHGSPGGPCGGRSYTILEHFLGVYEPISIGRFKIECGTFSRVTISFFVSEWEACSFCPANKFQLIATNQCFRCPVKYIIKCRKEFVCWSGLGCTMFFCRSGACNGSNTGIWSITPCTSPFVARRYRQNKAMQGLPGTRYIMITKIHLFVTIWLCYASLNQHSN